MRVFHCSLVVLFALAWATEDLQAVHQPIGYAILLLVVLRIGWGFVGSPHARFANFIRSPWATLAYARGLLTGPAPCPLGHNPVASVMELALLIMLVATAREKLVRRTSVDVHYLARRLKALGHDPSWRRRNT